MSSLLGGTSGQSGVSVGCQSDDIRNAPNWLVDLDPFMYARIAVGWDLMMGWETPWWPRGANLDASGDEWCQGISWQTPELITPGMSGTNSRLGIVGITYDKFGTPLAGVTCKLFRTIGDLYKDVLIDETISDASGNYLLSTPFYPDAHYVVFYKVGSPDVFGTSPNTLTGS
jgi:hypothetical protein